MIIFLGHHRVIDKRSTKMKTLLLATVALAALSGPSLAHTMLTGTASHAYECAVQSGNEATFPTAGKAHVRIDGNTQYADVAFEGVIDGDGLPRTDTVTHEPLLIHIEPTPGYPGLMIAWGATRSGVASSTITTDPDGRLIGNLRIPGPWPRRTNPPPGPDSMPYWGSFDCQEAANPGAAQAEAEARTAAQAQAEAAARAKLEQEARAKADADRAKLEQEASAKVEAERAQIEAEERNKVELDRAKIEAETRAKVAAEIRAKVEAEARAKAEAEERAKTETDAKAQIEAATRDKDAALADFRSKTAARAQAEIEAQQRDKQRVEEQAAAEFRANQREIQLQGDRVKAEEASKHAAAVQRWRLNIEMARANPSSQEAVNYQSFREGCAGGNGHQPDLRGSMDEVCQNLREAEKLEGVKPAPQRIAPNPLAAVLYGAPIPKAICSQLPGAIFNSQSELQEARRRCGQKRYEG
jgi:hypothetical protein